MNVFLVPVRDCNQVGEVIKHWRQDGEFCVSISDCEDIGIFERVNRSKLLPIVATEGGNVWACYRAGKSGPVRYRLLCQRKGGLK